MTAPMRRVETCPSIIQDFAQKPWLELSRVHPKKSPKHTLTFALRTGTSHQRPVSHMLPAISDLQLSHLLPQVTSCLGKVLPQEVGSTSLENHQNNQRLGAMRESRSCIAMPFGVKAFAEKETKTVGVRCPFDGHGVGWCLDGVGVHRAGKSLIGRLTTRNNG